MSDNVLNQFKQTKVEEKKDAGRKLKVGIIGTGWIAESHIECLKQMPDVEIVAGADLIPGKAERFFERYGVQGVRCYPSHKEMIDAEELDAVSVCTYNRQHAAPTIYALDHGVNVLLESRCASPPRRRSRLCAPRGAAGRSCRSASSPVWTTI